MLISKFFKYFVNSFEFIKKHPDILYSLALIVVVPFAMYFTVIRVTSSFQEGIDFVMWQKALLAENTLDVFFVDYINDRQILNEKMEQFVEKNTDISFLDIKIKNGDNFNQIFIYPEEMKDRPKWNSQELAALKGAEWKTWESNTSTAVMTLQNNIRYWNVLKPIHDKAGNKIGIFQMALSLADADALSNQKLQETYIMLIIAIILVLFLIINHTRLFEYSVLFRKIKEIDKSKDEFISITAHELKTPIAVIKGYAQILQEKAASVLNTEQSSYLTTIISSSNNLSNLITDLLEVSRIEQGRIDLVMQKISPANIIEEVAGNLKPKAEEKGLTMDFIKMTEQVSVFADPARLNQILVNLIGNSIKYTKSGKIEITESVIKEKYYIAVKDTGLGMSAEAQNKLFGKFYRIKNVNTEGISGTGLGLWITKALCERMNGEIFLESMEGVGSKFTVVFPLVKNNI